MTVFNHTDQFFAQGLQQSLYDMMKNNVLCDVTLRVDGQDLCVHKNILAASSPYFRTMFKADSGFKESKEDIVSLYGISFDTISLIIKFLYTSHIEISEKNVYDLMESADLFQINSLRICVSHYLSSLLCLENCLVLYVTSNLRNYHDLSKEAFRYILSNFQNIIETEIFEQIPINYLLDILSSKWLNVTDEGVLLKSVIKWIKSDLIKRKDHLESLLDKINLMQVPMQDLLSVKNDILFRPNHLQTKIAYIITEILAKKYECTAEDFMSFWRSEINERKTRYDAEQEVIFAIGGESSGTASRTVECFTLGYDKWKCVVPMYIVPNCTGLETAVIPTLRCARYNAAVAHDHYNIFVLGGRNSTEYFGVCETYDIKTNQWKNLACLPVKMEGCGAAIVEGKLIVVGGRDETGPVGLTLEYDRKHNKWKELQPMRKSR